MDFQFQDDDMIMAKILLPAGSDVQVGVPVCLVVDDEKDVAAVAAGTYSAAAAAPAAPAAKAAAPVAPALVAAPAPVAKPAAAPKAAAAPAAAPAGGEAEYLAWPRWGTSLVSSPLGGAVLAKQKAYSASFGATGQEME
jgi:pyruvate/2-oxoglutarate dehydrogenase complex dihydrolipoamide acyltransferase (E2) component